MKVHERAGARRWALLLVLSALLAGGSTLSGGPGARRVAAQAALWTQQFGTTGSDDSRGVSVDGAGNVYVAGQVTGALPGQTPGGGVDAYVRKYSGSGAVLWTRQIGGAAKERAMAVTASTAGDVFVAGSSDGVVGVDPLAAIWIRKYDTAGMELWTRVISTNVTGIRGLGVDGAGNLFVGGTTFGALPGQTALGSNDMFVRKYNGAGTELWTRQFGSSVFDDAFGLAATPAGGAVIVGWTGGTFPNQTSAGAFDAVVRQYDADGNELWTRQFGTTADDKAGGVAVAPNGDVYVTGETGGLLAGSRVVGLADGFLRRFDSAGATVWTRQFGTASAEVSRNVAVAGDGHSYVAGYTSGAFVGQRNAGGLDVFVRQYDTAGSAQWTTEFGSTTSDTVSGIAADGAGGVYVAGSTSGVLPGQTAGGSVDAFVRKLGATAPTTGLLRVATTPAVPALILIDGQPRDYWGLAWLELPVGTYTVDFGPVAGYATPAPQSVTITAGQTTTVTGNFVAQGYLEIRTTPAVAAQVSVDGVPRDDWGAFLDFPVGAHQVCFGPVEGFVPPPCQQATVVAGQTTVVAGNYTANPNGQGCATCGLLRVTTNPALPALISINGVPRDYYGLAWLELPAGSYTVTFGPVAGYTAGAARQVTVAAGQTTTLTGDYTPLGFVRVETRLGNGGPAANATIYIDGLPRNTFGAWPDIAPGAHEVCFGDVPGYETPACQTPTVTAGQTTVVTGTYLPDSPAASRPAARPAPARPTATPPPARPTTSPTPTRPAPLH